MCRMFAIISHTPFQLGSYIDTLSHMAEFSSHAPHADGYGIAYYDRQFIIHKAIEPIWQHDTTLDAVTSTAAVMHARKSSFGAKTIENVHPFIENTRHGPFLFMHNGTIYDAQELFSAFTGTKDVCDSRIIADAIARSADDCRSFHDAVYHVSTTIYHKSSNYTSANAIILHDATMYCIRTCCVEEDYYTLYYSLQNDLLMVSTDPFGDYTWTLLENHTVTSFSPNEKSFTIKTVPIR